MMTDEYKPNLSEELFNSALKQVQAQSDKREGVNLIIDRVVNSVDEFGELMEPQRGALIGSLIGTFQMIGAFGLEGYCAKLKELTE